MSFVEEPVVRLENLSFWYSGEPALRDVNLEIPRHAITVVFGPAGSGKTTLLRIINRLTDLNTDGRIEGRVLLSGQDIHDPAVDVVALRRRVGMVFALPSRCRAPSATTSPTGPSWRARGIAARWTRSSSAASARLRCGMR